MTPLQRTVLACVALFLPCIAIAAIPPDVPAQALPAAYRPIHPIPPLELPATIPDPAGPMTLARLARLTLGQSLYISLRDQARRNANVAPTSDATSDASTVTSTPHLRAYSTAGGGTTLDLSNDEKQDVEPSTASVNINGLLHTTTVTTKFEPCWNVANAYCTWLYAYSTDPAHPNQYLGPIRIPMPIDRYTRQYAWNVMADPLLSVNPYSNGVWGKRLYLSGLLHDYSNPTGYPSAIAVWHSDDGGLTWSNAAIVDLISGAGYVADKPAITVSWHNGVDLGYVYVTYNVVYGASGGQTQVRTAVSTDGGVGFTPVTITTADTAFTQIAVDKDGIVHTFWVNIPNAQINSATSTNYGLTYSSAPFEVVANQFVVTGQTIDGFEPTRANSVAMVRYDWHDERIALVYYGRAGNGHFQVYYTYKPGCTTCNSSGWPVTPVTITSSAYDHFNAALDYNKSTGNLIVPFYRSFSSGGLTYYDEYASYITSSGTLLQAEFRLSPASYHSGNQLPKSGFIGDYQDAWDDLYSSEQVLGAWIGTDAGDVMLTPITY